VLNLIISTSNFSFNFSATAIFCSGNTIDQSLKRLKPRPPLNQGRLLLASPTSETFYSDAILTGSCRQYGGCIVSELHFPQKHRSSFEKCNIKQRCLHINNAQMSDKMADDVISDITEMTLIIGVI